MAEKDATARLRRAVKENNLFLVKRLIQRTDIRNPDPGPRRYTSLAWAAVLGHEETFEYLLAAGHDDEELSKDAENNTIIILLAELRPGATASFGASAGHPDLMGAALRMARLYYERYPFILEWSNLHGKTALHVAALKGNEELVRMLCDMGADYDLPDNLGNTPLHYASAWGHIPVVQLLIERGCQFAARNNESFTALDYAYSTNTMTILQETALMQHEANKKARRHVYQQAAARGNEWGGLTSDAAPMHPQALSKAGQASNGSSRLRSGSGGSRTTSTSDSGEAEGLRASPVPHSYRQSSFSSTSSQPQSSTHSSTGSFSRSPLPHSFSYSSSSNTAVAHPVPSSNNSSIAASINPASVLSPIATRMRERDADAIAKFKKRNRSDSAGNSSSTSHNGVGVSGLPLANTDGFTSAASLSGASRLASRRLRPSMSAAQLRSSPPPPPGIADQQGSRSRSGTNPTLARPNPPTFSPPAEIDEPSYNQSPAASRGGDTRNGARRGATVPTRLNETGDYTGPPSEYAIFPPPPTNTGDSHDEGNSSKVTTPTARRAAFALLSKPLPSIEVSGSVGGRGHRRGTSTSELRG